MASGRPYNSVRSIGASVSALEALEKEQQRPSITTLCRSIDGMFAGQGGIPIAKVTEVCGIAGIGKTQLCLQLCVNVQIPESLGGLGGSALYIDTEGSFSAERLQEIAKATVDVINRASSHTLNTSSPETAAISAQVQSAITLRQIMENIRIVRVFSHQEQIDLVNELDDLVRQDPSKIRLIIIDSIALHFRHTFRDIAQRSRILTGMAQTLRQIAQVHGIAIVVTNQMTTKIIAKGTDEEAAMMVPALGDSWAHACTNRVILLWHKGERHAWLCKSPNAEDAIVPFSILTDGVRDLQLDN